MQDLTALILQTEIIWENPAENRANIERLLKDQSADLIVLPETFSTGFSMNSQQIAETMEGETVSWMKATAKRLNAVLTGSVAIADGAKRYNRLIWATPTGEVQYYNKRHLFGLLGESAAYTRGTERKIFKLGEWRICPQICYDLRFPVWCRNQEDYDLFLVVANWPSVRHYAWDTLLHARAIENQCYVIAANRVGRDPKDLEFGGGSLVIDPLGKTIEKLGSEQAIIRVSLMSSEVAAIRDKLPFLADRDRYSLDI